jgi:O-antigen biosynthesis protein
MNRDRTNRHAPRRSASGLTPSGRVGIPMVSCIMPTRNRWDFVLQSIRYFRRQDYPSRELIIIADSNGHFEFEHRRDELIRYISLPGEATIGAKRNRGCELARGSIIMQWDDDDWYAPGRIRVQTTPLINGTADISGLIAGLVFDVDRWEFWRCSAALRKSMFYGDIHCGTLAFRRSLLSDGLCYPDQSLAEEAWFLHRAAQRGARVCRIPGESLFIYVRHGKNSWSFVCGEFIDKQGWECVAPPHLIGDDSAFYWAKHREVTH